MNPYKEKILKHKEFFLWHLFGLAYRKNENKFGITLREDRIVFFQNVLKSRKDKVESVNILKNYTKKYLIKKNKEFDSNKSIKKTLELAYLFPSDFTIELIAPPKFYNGEKNIICFSVFTKKENTVYSNFIFCYKNEILISIYFPDDIDFENLRTIEYLTTYIDSSFGNNDKNKNDKKFNIPKLVPRLKLTEADNYVNAQLSSFIDGPDNIIGKIHDVAETMFKDKFLCEHMLKTFTKVLTDKTNIYEEAKNYINLETNNEVRVDLERILFQKEIKSFSKQLLNTTWNNLTENENKLKEFENSVYNKVKDFYLEKTDGLFSNKGWVELENIIELKDVSIKIKKLKKFAKTNPIISSFLAMSSNRGFKMLLSFNPITLGISLLIDYFINELIEEFFEESGDFLNLREEYSKASFANEIINKTKDKANKFTQDITLPLLQQLSDVFNQSYRELESSKAKDNFVEDFKNLIITTQNELENIHTNILDAKSYYENLWDEINNRVKIKIDDVPSWYKPKYSEDKELIKILLETKTAFSNACNTPNASHLIKSEYHILHFNYCLALHLYQQRDERFSYEIYYEEENSTSPEYGGMAVYSAYVDGKNIENISNYFSDLNNREILKSFFRFQNDSGEKTAESVIKRIYFLYSYKTELASVLNSIIPSSLPTQAFFDKIIENSFIQVNYSIKKGTKNILASILSRMLGPWIDRLNWDTIESSFAYNFTKETYGPKKRKPFGYDYELIKSRMAQSDINNKIGLYYVVNFKTLNSFEYTLDSIEIEFYNDYFSDYNSVIIRNSPVPKKVLYKAICYL